MKKRPSPTTVAKQQPQSSKELKQLRAQLAAKEKQITHLETCLEQSRNATFRFKKQRPGRRGKGDYVRFFLPDTHGCFVDQAALSACLHDLEALQPRQVFMMGDHLDCGGFLAQHHTLGFVAQADYTFEDDIVAANTLLDEVQKRCPKAEIVYLEGNHEERIEKFCVTSALRNKVDAELLRRSIGTESVLNLEKRGIRYIRKALTYDGCRVQGTVRAGKCFVTHGTSHGKNAANAMLSRFGACVVFGHVHKLMSATDRNVKDGEFAAWSVGHLSKQQPLWRHGHPTDWSQGYGFQVVTKQEDFLHINVPIIDGRSYLAPHGDALT
ncbi:MAG: hypothetical protein NXI04_28890 [Planctomycetaceae bacterium]|nr:hypothetical protein [Planctomycetaceae bacterium]